MGVRGLQTFLERYCPDACYEVDLRSLIADNKRKTGRTPQIVVDAQSCFKMWSEGLNWTIGLEIEELVHRLRKFVEAFAAIGAELVFYFGGTTPEKKRVTWLRRRVESMRKMMNVFDLYQRGYSFDQIPPDLSSIPPKMGNVTSAILKYIFKCVVYVTIDECDEEIIKYVHEHKSFAVFAQNTDFIVSNVDCVVLSSMNFNVESMTTILYDRVSLSRTLNIETDKLPILSILAGNDLIPPEMLKEFHSSLCGSSNQRFIPYSELMPALAKYISRLPKVPVDALLKILCCDVFNDVSKLNEIKVSYDSYFIHPGSDVNQAADKWSRILQVARSGVRDMTMPHTVFSILNERINECSVNFEDFRKVNDGNKQRCNLPSSTITRRLRQRMYGVLLYEIRHTKPTVTEWCAENLNSFRSAIVVEPVFPKAHHPGLLVLWDSKKAVKHFEHKWMLFLKSVSSKIQAIEEWSSLDEDVLLAAAVCYYLYEEQYLLKFEVDAILATIVMKKFYNRSKLRSLTFTAPNLRAAQLAVTFIRAFTDMLSLLAACGYPVQLSERVAVIGLEARLFQTMYRRAKNRKTYEELCDNNESGMKIFHRLKDLIYKESSASKQGGTSTRIYRCRKRRTTIRK